MTQPFKLRSAVEDVMAKELNSFIAIRVRKWAARYELTRDEAELVCGAALLRAGASIFGKQLQLDEYDTNNLLSEIGTMIQKLTPPTPIPVTNVYGPQSIPSSLQEMIEAINRYRALHERPALQPSPILMELADYRSAAMDHHFQGKWVWEAARQDFHFNGFCTDNLAQGYPDGVSAVGDNSSGWGDEREGHTVGHNKQMLGFFKINGKWVDFGFNLVGVGINPSAKIYCAVFGRLSGRAEKDNRIPSLVNCTEHPLTEPGPFFAHGEVGIPSPCAAAYCPY